MINLCGYNLCGDINALDVYPTDMPNTNVVKVGGAIYDHVNISSNVTDPISNIPPIWDSESIINCDFNGNTYGGNIQLSLDGINRLKLKRREYGTYNWITILDKPIQYASDIMFSYLDRLTPSGKKYYYALVPCLNDNEGNYIEIVDPIETNFNGIFICERDNMIRLQNGVGYSDMVSNQAIGQIQTLGGKYPTIVKNSNMDYVSGSISGTVLGANFEDTRLIDREDIVSQLSAYEAILKDGKPKIIKDWNGNIWLVVITSSISKSYKNEIGMGIVDVSFSFAEQGEYDNQRDLYENGFVDTL